MGVKIFYSGNIPNMSFDVLFSFFNATIGLVTDVIMAVWPGGV